MKTENFSDENLEEVYLPRSNEEVLSKIEVMYEQIEDLSPSQFYRELARLLGDKDVDEENLAEEPTEVYGVSEIGSEDFQFKQDSDQHMSGPEMLEILNEDPDKGSTM